MYLVIEFKKNKQLHISDSDLAHWDLQNGNIIMLKKFHFLTEPELEYLIPSVPQLNRIPGFSQV